MKSLYLATRLRGLFSGQCVSKCRRAFTVFCGPYDEY